MSLPPLSQMASLEGGWKSANPKDLTETKLCIFVREHSLISRQSIILGDIARLSNGSHEIRAKAAAVKLAPAPKVDATARLSESQILAALVEAGIEENDFRLQVPRMVMAARATQTLNRETMIAEVEAFFRKCSGQNAKEILFRDWNLPESVKVPVGKVKFSTEIRQRGKGIGTQSFELAVKVDGETAQSLRGSVFIDTMVDVARALTSIPRGSQIQPGQLGVSKEYLSTLPAQALLNPMEAIGMSSNRAFAAGDIIRADQLKSFIVIKRNDVVLMEVKNGHMKLQTKGVAVGAGAIGDVVKVINPSSGKEVMARVTGPQRVEVIF